MALVWLLKLMLCADNVALGPEVKPTPSNATDWGLPPVSSVIRMEALRGPAWVGIKVTFTVQFAPAVSVEPQLLF